MAQRHRGLTPPPVICCEELWNAPTGERLYPGAWRAKSPKRQHDRHGCPRVGSYRHRAPALPISAVESRVKSGDEDGAGEAPAKEQRRDLRELQPFPKKQQAWPPEAFRTLPLLARLCWRRGGWQAPMARHRTQRRGGSRG